MRVEASDGVYHVINLGNYRAHVFADDGAKSFFANRLAKLTQSEAAAAAKLAAWSAPSRRN